MVTSDSITKQGGIGISNGMCDSGGCGCDALRQSRKCEGLCTEKSARRGMS
jgi:hypothetical protein